MKKHWLCVVVSVALSAGVVVGPEAVGAGSRSRRGGSIVYALDAETTGGWCLPQAQLSAAGLQVATAIFDTLTATNTKGEVVGNLAEVTANADATEFTIALRPDVEFHDGTSLDAAAVKLNLDSFRGANPRLPARLLAFVYQAVSAVTVIGPLTVAVTTSQPWPAFPRYLSSIRYGMAAPSQLNDPATCASNPVGTGPFEFEEWRVNESLTVLRNRSYWRDGLPKLDEIVFRPVPESIQRVNGLRSGDLDVVQTSNSMSIVELRRDAEAGEIRIVVSDEGAETAYLMLNNSKAPFDDSVARQAVAFSSDAREVNEVQNMGLNRIATGPFPPDSPAYLPDIARHHDLRRGRRLARRYEQAHGEPIRFEYLTGTDPDLVKVAQQVQEQQSRAGIKVTIRSVDQSTLINEALAGNFQAVGWRNHPGGDPDSNYVWWHSDSPVNFGRIDDPVVDQLLEEGRVETDLAKRTAIYQDLNRRFAEQLYNLWSWYTLWAVATRNDVRGIAGPALPDGGGRPLALYGGVIPVLGIVKG